ncbi:MAG: hypothetical protein P8J14_01490 [Emcibacteraceae bacterium]|nr:hypothetical protein [Emcibacteraceae bacterium]
MMAFLKILAVNSARMFFNMTFALWAMKLAARCTDNSIDDEAVALIDALYKNDAVKAKDSIKKLAERVS